MGKHRTPLCLENKDGCSEDPNSTSHLYSLSDKDFTEAMWKMFKKLKEIIEQTE